MARKTMGRIVALAIAFILIAAVACGGLVMCSSDSPFENTRTHAINTLLDKTGIKARLERELYAYADKIARETGVPVELINKAIETLDVQHWEVATLPDDVTETGSLSTEYQGHKLKVITYDDPNYVTFEALGQSVTFDVPTSAEAYSTLVPYVSTAQDIGLLDFVEEAGGL